MPKKKTEVDPAEELRRLRELARNAIKMEDRDLKYRALIEMAGTRWVADRHRRILRLEEKRQWG